MFGVAMILLGFANLIYSVVEEEISAKGKIAKTTKAVSGGISSVIRGEK